MLPELASTATNLPDVWGEGAIFAFSGLDGPTDTASGFVATFAAEPFGLLIHTPRRRVLTLAAPAGQAAGVRIATGDVLGVELASGELVAAFGAWHTIAGAAPQSVRPSLRMEDGLPAWGDDSLGICEDRDAGDAVALARSAGRFALSYGRSAKQAADRARAALAADLRRVADRRLALLAEAPTLGDAGLDRLLKKCLSVMKVNALAPEGAIRHTWSTPDRVPHRHMWLWDSVFHTLAMNRFRPDAAWDFLQCVLETQEQQGPAAGMIPHMAGVDGSRSAITQPPLLAWGVWENYLAKPIEARLRFALPRLEAYLEWDRAHRDWNRNGLLEWLIESDERCRSGESGMDNSPRFDAGAVLDAVDFSVFAAHDMACLAKIAERLGLDDKAAMWRSRAAELSAAVHRLLWDPRDRFYHDRDLKGDLSRVEASSGLLPLLLEDTPPEHIEGLVEALKDPRRFNTAFPVPSVAVREPTWSTDMWRGATWVNTDYLLILGLRRHGRRDEADWLAAKVVQFVRKHYEQYGVLFEFFDALDERPPVACDRKGPRQEPYDLRRKVDSIRDYHWTAALTACLLLEQVDTPNP